jgi:hypothetical protein
MKNQSQFAEKLGITQTTLSKYENGTSDIPDEIKIKLSSFGINIHWLLIGKGPMFWPEDDQLQVEVHNSGAVNGIINAIGNVGGNNEVTISNPELPSASIKTDIKTVRNMSVFEIPLLTKEQVLQFDPVREIPNPQAHSGEYPDYMLVPMPRRFVEYSTDLRAIVVFNGLMAPLLNPGDVAIFQATGWGGDGVYVYRMGRDLHISHVKSCRQDFQLTKEFRPDEEISYDARSFETIGRVRAVVREIG